jgi:hypothetical protein
MFVDLFQIQCLQRSHHRKWNVQRQEVFHAGQFYVHIFQLNDSFPITSLRSKFAVQIPRCTSDGDSAASIGFERGQQTYSTVCIENLRDTRHLSESHRKLVKNVDFNKQTFPGINKKEQDRVRTRFSMDVTKRCTSYYAVRCIAEFSYNFRHMSCKLFMCLFYLSTASLRNIHWKSCPYSIL